jgi:hypothetical protein
MSETSTRGERIDAALSALEAAVDQWCEVARLGPCPCCSNVVKMYEPWSSVELTFVLGHQNGKPAALGVVRGAAYARLHRDCDDGEEAYCVAVLEERGRRAKTPEAALASIAKRVLADRRRIVRERHARAERPVD